MPSYEGLDEFWYVKQYFLHKWFDIDVLYFYKVKKLKNINNGIIWGYTLGQKLNKIKSLPLTTSRPWSRSTIYNDIKDTKNSK